MLPPSGCLLSSDERLESSMLVVPSDRGCRRVSSVEGDPGREVRDEGDTGVYGAGAQGCCRGEGTARGDGTPSEVVRGAGEGMEREEGAVIGDATADMVE